MTIPVRPQLILKASNNDASFASYFHGMVESLQSIISIFSSPLLGAVSDVIGRKPILVLSHIGELIGLLLVATFPTSLAWQLPAYLLIALTSAYFSTVNTIIADISMHPGSPSTNQQVSSTTNYGRLGAMFGLCFLVGPGLGGYIEEKLYLGSSFRVACVLIVIAMVYVAMFVPETKEMERDAVLGGEMRGVGEWIRNLRDAVRNTDVNPVPRVKQLFGGNAGLTWIAVSIATGAFAQSGLYSIMILYMHVRLGWETKETGFFLSMIGLSMLISQGVLAPISVKVFGEVGTILAGYSLSAVHYWIYAVARSGGMMYVGMVVGMFSSVSGPAMKGLLARQVGKESQGSLQGSLSALNSLVGPVAPIISSGLFGYGNKIGQPGLPLLVLAGIEGLSVVFAGIGFWKPGLK